MTAKGNHFQWFEPEQTPGRKLRASEVLSFAAEGWRERQKINMMCSGAQQARTLLRNGTNHKILAVLPGPCYVQNIWTRRLHMNVDWSFMSKCQLLTFFFLILFLILLPANSHPHIMHQLPSEEVVG